MIDVPYREEHLTGDVPGEVGGEPRDERRDVAGIARIELGVLVGLERRLVGALGHGDQPGRARRRHAVRPHAVALHLERECDREHRDPALRGGVVRLPDVPLETHERAGADDRRVHRAVDLLGAVAPVRARVPTRRVVPSEVDLDDRVPVVLVHVEDHPVAQDARVVHEHVEAAEGVDRLLHHVARAVEIGDVVEVGDGLAATRPDDLGNFLGRPAVGAFAASRAAEVVHDDARARGGEVQGVAAAHAVARPGDDGDLAVQDAHCRSSPKQLRASLDAPGYFLTYVLYTSMRGTPKTSGRYTTFARRSGSYALMVGFHTSRSWSAFFVM